MFVARLRPLYYISDKVIVRNLRNSRLNVTGANPGLDRRIKAFQNDGLKIEDEDAEEFIEKSDSDFSNVSEILTSSILVISCILFCHKSSDLLTMLVHC